MIDATEKETIESLRQERDDFATLAEQNRATAFERGELLDAQTTTNARLRAALEPFAALVKNSFQNSSDADFIYQFYNPGTGEGMGITVGHFRAAKSTLAESSPDPVAFDHAAECEKLRGVRDKIQIENNDLRAECERLRAQLATQEEGHIQNFADATRRNLDSTQPEISSSPASDATPQRVILDARLIADAPQLAAENKALRKENAELKENFNDLRDENAELLSACGTNSAHTALKAIREIVADRDRLQEQVRLACWSSSLCSMHREPRGDCEICNGARLMAEKRREVAALQEQVRVLREAGKPFGDVATQVGGASLWLRFEQWGKTSGVEVTNECLVMRNALAATAEPTETKP